MRRSPIILAAATGITLCALPSVAHAGWQGGSRRAKCVRPQSELTTEQQQSLSAAVRGGTVVWNAAGQMAQSSSSAATHQVLSQGMFDQAWIRYELCVALDNNHIDQATYNRLLEQSLQGSFSSTGSPSPASAPTPTAPVAVAPTPTYTPTPTPAPTSSTPAGSTEWIEQIRSQTQLRSGESFANMAAYGYSMRDVADTGLLDASTAKDVPLSLPGGYEYALMGVCDNDCSDLDLAIYQGGTELAVDTSQDDWPVVTITPSGGSSYTARVSMYQCATRNCGYQLTVWQRPIQAAAPAPAQSSSGPAPIPIQPGVQAWGALDSSDHTLPNGEWADRYTVSIRAGQTVSASMSSFDIDTYLVALAPSGATLDNDDCDGDRNRSCLSFVAPEGGTWTLYATSYQGSDDGNYDFQVDLR